MLGTRNFRIKRTLLSNSSCKILSGNRECGDMNMKLLLNEKQTLSGTGYWFFRNLDIYVIKSLNNVQLKFNLN